MIHMSSPLSIDLFFSYMAIPGAILVALVLWGAWKLTEPEDETRREKTETPAQSRRSA